MPCRSVRITWWSVHGLRGFGIRWFSPIGPLRFEWGFPFARKPGELSHGVQLLYRTAVLSVRIDRLRLYDVLRPIPIMVKEINSMSSRSILVWLCDLPDARGSCRCRRRCADDLKIGVVDMQKALLTVDAGKRAKAQLEKEVNAKSKEIQSEEAAIKKMGEEFQKQRSS